MAKFLHNSVLNKHRTMSDKKKLNEDIPEENTEIRDVLDDSTADTETADITVDEA